MLRTTWAVAVGLTLIATAAGADTGEGRKDLQVFNDISKAVTRYAQFTIFDSVDANVKDGVVTLTGRVTMPYKKDAIEKRVAKIDGVRQVRDEITVLPVSQFDDRLRYRIARAIYGNPNFWNYAIMADPPVHIVVEHSRVTLTGVVQSDVERMLARSIAGSQFGVMSVVNNLKTDAEARDALEKAF
jgi:osmotically-inducible protein OsmY